MFGIRKLGHHGAALMRTGAVLLPAVLCLTALPGAAHAGLGLSPLILDLKPDQAARGDVELQNNGPERLFVVVEASLIADPGLPSERRITEPDPGKLGLIATPGRLILEGGQRKFLRLAALQPPGDKDRIYRVTVKPVVGEVSGSTTGLKLLVGYDMLVIQRPAAPKAAVAGARAGAHLTLTNTGNTNAELFRGRECDPSGARCTDAPSQRLYPGAAVTLQARPGSRVSYVMKVAGQVSQVSF